MKKVLLLFLLIILCSCKQSEDVQEVSYHIVSPTGAPSLAFLNEFENSDFETNSVSKNIIAMLNSDSGADIIVIDSVNGIKAINNGAPYKLLANLTFGNFYLASTGNDENEVLEKGDSIVIFGQNSTPDLVFHFIYGNDFDENIEYVDSVADAGKVLAMGKNLASDTSIDYVFMAEPVLSNILNNDKALTYGKAKVYANIQDLYYEKTGQSMIQASIFVKDGLNVDEYANNLEKEVTRLLNDSAYVESLLEGKDSEELSKVYGIGSNMIKLILSNNSINLGYKKAIDNKEAIDTFIGIYGLQKTNEEIYYN